MTDRPSRCRAGLVMIVDGRFPTPSGGAESQVVTLGRRLRQIGYNVHVLAIYRGEKRRTRRYGPLLVSRMATSRIPGLAIIGLIFNVCCWLLRHRHRYQAIHVHRAGYLAAVAALIGRIVGATVIIKVTGFSDMDEGALNPARRDPGSLIMRRIFHWAEFQATSGAIENRLLRLGYSSDRIHRIPNAVDTVKLKSPVRSERAVRRFVYLGRLETVKGITDLLDAWDLAALEASELLIAGNGALDDVLPERVVNPNVTLLGPVADIPGYLGDADIAVLPSHTEGLSNSLLEFMAAGLPVIGTRVSGTEDLIAPTEGGWLIEPKGVEGLARALTEAASMPYEQLASYGRRNERRIGDYASVNKVVAALDQAYGNPASQWNPTCAG